MTVYCLFTVNVEGVTCATAVRTVDHMKFLKDKYCVVMVDGGHLRCYSEMVKGIDGVEWATEPLFMRYTFQVYGKPMSLAQAIKLSNIGNISTAIVQREVTVTYTI